MFLSTEPNAGNKSSEVTRWLVGLWLALRVTAARLVACVRRVIRLILMLIVLVPLVLVGFVGWAVIMGLLLAAALVVGILMALSR